MVTRLAIVALQLGTGCIALLLYSLLHRTVPNIHAHGIDISPQAVQLARENVRYNASRGLMPSPSPPPPSPPHHQPLVFSQADIFSDALLEGLATPRGQEGAQKQQQPPSPPWDVIVCNPPYVSHWGFAHQTARDVRNYEPKLAQVPMVAYDGGGDHEPEDVFYARLLDIGARLGPRVMLFEVGDLKQALRVVEMALGHKGLSSSGVEVRAEVWRDWPDATPEEDEETSAGVCGGSRQVQIRGSGHGRSVFIQCR
ncbi:hypothetical protein VMCG_02905 [Cytospora schulzeri]|uniref:Methyltransferase domain-containing protein n=1 Tax=Cytospora schulzeri TaxID=448051 RepID=A0A423WZR1_9PEZI|nr:hypothetical protein VMCG_02905 [Valsa malicola]